MKAATKAPVAERPKAHDAEPKEPKRSQFEQFAEVVVALREEAQKAKAKRVELYHSLPLREKKRIDGLARQVKDSSHPLQIEHVLDTTDREKVKAKNIKPELEARIAIKERFDSGSANEVTPDQERFAKFITAAPLAGETQKAVDKLRAKKEKDGLSKKEQQQLAELKLGMVAFNHTLKLIIQHCDGSFSRDQLIGWMTKVGEWPHDTASSRVAGMVTEVVGDNVVRHMPEVTSTKQPTLEQDGKGIDLLVYHRAGRKYQIDFKTGSKVPDINDIDDEEVSPDVVVVGIEQRYIEGFKLKELYRKEIEQHIRSECNMPTLVD